MARISKVSELQARKQALVTESELFRQNLLTDFDQLKNHANGWVRTADRFRQIGPWLKFAAPVVLPLLGLLVGKRFRMKQPARPKPTQGKMGKVLWALRLFSRYGPMLRSLASRVRTRHNSEPRFARANDR